MVLDFPNRLPSDSIDPTLLTRMLASELPAIIRKAAISYLKAVEDHSGSDIWNALPVRMLQERKKLQYSTDPLFSFINSERVELGPELYTLESIFISQLKTYASLKFSSSAITWNEDHYPNAFSDFDLQVVTAEKPWPQSIQ